MNSKFLFKPLQADDLEQLCDWLEKPHVLEWWNDHLTRAEIKQKYGSRIGDCIVCPYIAYLDHKPIGFIQYYWTSKVGNGWWPNEDEGTVGLDQFIGEEKFLNKGYGSQMLAAFVQTLLMNPLINKIIIDVDPNNLRAKKCYLKAGFRMASEIKTPDGEVILMEMKKSKSVPISKSKEALAWITGILEKNSIRFQIGGGLAAKTYGSTRPLADIDIDIPETDFEKIKKHVSEFITFGPSHYKSDSWDLFLMTLNYHGQEIDLSGAYNTKVYDAVGKTWVRLMTDLSKANCIEVFGLKLPVIPCHELIAYKKILSRPVDLLDIDEIIKYKK